MIEQIFSVIAPVFLVIGAGYAAVRIGYFNDELIDGLSRFALGFAIPVLLFRATYTLNVHQSFDKGMLIAFYMGAFISFILGCLSSRYLFKNRPGESVVIGFGALFSNSVLLGLAITEQAYGEAALVNNYIIVSFHAPFCYLLGISVMEWASADGKGAFETSKIIAKSMSRNALMVGIATGFMFNLIGIALPQWMMSAVDLFAEASLPVALFSLGGVLTRYRLHQRIGEALVIVALSIIVHPLITYILGHYVFGLSSDKLRSAVITASMAPGINAYIFAQMYHRAEGVAANVVLIGTLLSIGTVSMWLALLGL